MNKIFKQSSHYFWGEALIMASGIISFPILTRIFTKYEYGLMSLLTVTATIIGSIASLGANRSLVRFYHNYKKKNQETTFFGTLVSSLFLSGIAAILLATLVTRLLLIWNIVSDDFYSLLPFAMVWIILQNLFMYMYTIYRLEEQVFIYNLLGIFRKYAGMITAIIMVLIFHNLNSFYYGQIAIEFIFVVLLIFLIYRKLGPFIAQIPSKKIVTESFKYGFPLAISAISFKIFNMGDRYVIAHFLSVEQVASYSVAYMICNYFKEFIITPINLSLIPLTFKLWEQKKIDELKNTLHAATKYYYMIAIPAVFLFMLIPKEIITLLASEKYIDASPLMPIIMAGVMSGFILPFSAGFHLNKNTSMILTLTSIMAIFNIVLNMFFVPRMGIEGAAYATLISFMLYIISSYQLSKKHFRINIAYRSILGFIVFSVLSFMGTFYISKLIESNNNVIQLMAKSVIFISLYFMLIVMGDPRIRSKIVSSGNSLKLSFTKK